jgi:hypothetical protein
MLLNRKTIISSLEKNWETLLAVYKKNDYSIYKHKTSSYFFDINLPTNYNYLFLAKITNLLCNTGQLKNILRQLAKNEFHHAHLITLLYKKDINKSIFLRWLLRLSIEEFNKYMERYTIYLVKSELTIDWHSTQPEYIGTSVFFEFQDLLNLILCHSRINFWYIHSLTAIQKKNEINHKIIKFNGGSSSSFSLNYDRNFVLKKNKKVFHNIFNTKKYRKLFKQIIQISKPSIQIFLIKKINKIIKDWYQSLDFVLNKKEYRILNRLIYKSLWRWAILRHPRKPAQWIKKRYWQKTEYGLYFGDFSFPPGPTLGNSIKKKITIIN